MRAFLVLLAILLALLVGADFVAKGIAERRIAERVETSLELEEQPDVTIGGFPFLLNVFAGTIPSMEVTSRGVTRGDVTLEDVRLRLINVRFDFEALSRAGGDVRIGGGRGEASMTARALTQVLRAEGAPIVVRFAGEEVLVAADGVEGEGRGDIELERGELVVSAQGLPQSYAVELPRLGAGVGYRSIDVAAGVATLTLALRAGTLEL